MLDKVDKDAKVDPLEVGMNEVGGISFMTALNEAVKTGLLTKEQSNKVYVTAVTNAGRLFIGQPLLTVRDDGSYLNVKMVAEE